MRTLTAFDVDTDALADTFDRIADGLRSNDVALTQVETNHVANVEDTSSFFLGVEFAATHEYKDVVDAIEYVTDTDDPDVDRSDFAGRDE